MAVFAIPNPKKSIQVDFPIERIKLSVLNISLIDKKYKLTSSNDIFHQYTYEALEFLSLGVYIDIHLNKINDNKTEITIEIRRKLGSFDQSSEITNANNHLTKLFDYIAKLTIKSEVELQDLKTQTTKSSTKNIYPTEENLETIEEDSKSNAWYEKTWLVLILCVIFCPIGIYGLWRSSSISLIWKVLIPCFIALIIIFNSGGEIKNSQKDKIASILKNKIGSEITFKDIKIAEIEGGTAVIVDNNWCYWIDSNNKVYCVNGASKTIFRDATNSECEDAPIKAMYLEIEKVAK